MMSRQVHLELVLRRVLRAAMILTGYRRVCRRQGCRHGEVAPNDKLRHCRSANEAVAGAADPAPNRVLTGTTETLDRTDE